MALLDWGETIAASGIEDNMKTNRRWMKSALATSIDQRCALPFRRTAPTRVAVFVTNAESQKPVLAVAF
jgi:hypothetical protein